MKKGFIKFLVLALCVSLAVFSLACSASTSTSEESWVMGDPSEGLEYVLNEDGESYAVVGIGTCEDTDLVIPTTYNEKPVTTIKEDAFACCENLTSIAIGDSIVEIGDYALCMCSSLTRIEVTPDNTAFKSIDGNLYTKDGKTLIQYAIGKTDEEFVVPDGVETIESMSFYSCEKIKSVVISDSVKVVGERAFKYCTRLKSVVVGDGVTTIGKEAFSSCDFLTTLELGDSLITIGNAAFYLCSSLTSVEFGDNVTTIGEEAFYWCYSITNVVIGANMATIGQGAFEYCTGLTSVYYKGTESKWNSIEIGSLNERLVNATRSYI